VIFSSPADVGMVSVSNRSCAHNALTRQLHTAKAAGRQCFFMCRPSSAFRSHDSTFRPTDKAGASPDTAEDWKFGRLEGREEFG